MSKKHGKVKAGSKGPEPKKGKKGKKSKGENPVDVKLDKALKKAGKKKPVDEFPGQVHEITPEEALAAAQKREGITPEGILGAADRVLSDPNSSPGAREKAKKAKKRARLMMNTTPPPVKVFLPKEPDPVVEEVKAKLAKKREARAAAESLEDPGDPPGLKVGVVTPENGLVGKLDENLTKAPKKSKGKKGHKEKGAEESVMVAEIVETEKGRVIAVGESEPTTAADDFDTPAPEIAFNGNGQYVIHDLEKGGPRGFTRATTYIDCLSDRSLLEKWGRRIVLLGAAAVELNPDIPEASIMSRAYTAAQEYELALHRIDKKDRKGKLEVGERGDLEAAAKKEHNDALNALAEIAFTIGGGEEQAEKGTDLHALCELYDAALLAGSKNPEEALPADISPSDLADVRAYAAEMKRHGIEVVLIEQMVVDDARHVAGRLDRTVRFLPENATRRVYAVGDLKTGSVSFDPGKIGMQLLEYAESKAYDPANPTERVDLKLSKKVALLIHLPQGKAECHIYEVDLALAAKGLKLAGDVRAWRSEGKKVFDVKKPLTPATERNVTA